MRTPSPRGEGWDEGLRAAPRSPSPALRATSPQGEVTMRTPSPRGEGWDEGLRAAPRSPHPHCVRPLPKER